MSRKNNKSGCGTVVIIFLIIGIVSAYWPVILGVAGFLILIYIIYRTIKNKEEKLNNSCQYIESNINIMNQRENKACDIDIMDGHDFEYFCAKVLKNHGYENVEVTRGSGDQGVDITAERDGIKYAVQCKRYSQAVGNKSVQEIYAGKRFYGCHVGIIMTNNYFTSSAKELAQRNGIILWDRDVLTNLGCFNDSYNNNIYVHDYNNSSENHAFTDKEICNDFCEDNNDRNYNLDENESMVDSYVDNEPQVSNPYIHEKKHSTNEKINMYDKENGIYPAGNYLVGDDIESGKYLLTSRGNLTAGVSIYESYSKYKKDEPLSHNSFRGEYHLSLRENGLFVDVDNADMKRL